MKAYYLLNENQTIKKMSTKQFQGYQGTIEIGTLPLKYYNNFSKIVNGNFLLREEEYENLMSLKQEKEDILKWLFDNDWKVNKFVLGEWATNDVRWQEYVNERDMKRQRYDEVIALMSTYDYEE